MNARLMLAAGMLSLPWSAGLQAQTLPEAASKIVKGYEKEVEDLKYKLEQDLKLAREKMLASLEKLAKDLEKNGKAADARRVRAQIDVLKKGPMIVNAQPDPGSLTGYRGRNGQVFYFRVTGTTTGSIYGTDIYTDDSSLATAAVHAGVLTSGQTGVVKVTILAGQQAYPSSTRNGITSSRWDQWHGSFKVERP